MLLFVLLPGRKCLGEELVERLALLLGVDRKHHPLRALHHGEVLPAVEPDRLVVVLDREEEDGLVLAVGRVGCEVVLGGDAGGDPVVVSEGVAGGLERGLGNGVVGGEELEPERTGVP